MYYYVNITLYINNNFMKNKFKKGLILGGLLTVASVIGFAMAKGEKELSEEMQAELKMLSKKLQKKLGEMDDITKDSFNHLASVVVDEYAEKKALARDIKESFVSELQKKWNEMEEQYNNENNNN